MPELPEVETYIRELAPLLQGRSIVDVQVFWPRVVAAPDVSTFVRTMVGRRFQGFERRGKYLIFALSGGETLVVHLRMTGDLRVHPQATPADKHTRVVCTLDDGQDLHYRDQRKFGRIWLVSDPEQVTHGLGPEPLDSNFTAEILSKCLVGRRASIKALLLNQRLVAGIGNIYADEALFLAGIDPRRPGGDLTGEENARLHAAIGTVLQQGIAMRGSSLVNYAPPNGVKGSFQEHHNVFRRTGEPCPRCGEPIRRERLAQRSTHFCAFCQR
jgi:formamidopyrimidine-DNA glycosylase